MATRARKEPSLNELQESEAMYRLLVKTTPDAVITTDLKGNVTYASENAARMYGYKRSAELVGLSAFKLMPPQAALKAMRELPRVLKAGKLEGVEFEVIRKDGSRITTLVNADVLRDGKGKALGVIFTAVDVTGRKGAERALKESEAKFRMLFERSGTAVLTLDKAGRVLDANDTLLRETGYAKGELVGKRFTRFVPLKAVASLLPAFLGFTSGREPAARDYEFQYRRKGGEVRDAVIQSEFLKDLGVVIASFTDVTERKRAEDSLRAAKEYAERLIETANVIIVGLDSKGRILMFNDAARRITGYTKRELEGKSWFEAIVPRKRYPQVWREFAKLQKAGRVIDEFENPILTKGGEERFISWRNGTVRLEDGSLGTISFGMDVTGMRKAEQSLKESEERYRALVEESPYPTLLIGLNGNIMLVSDGIRKVLGYSPKEIKGKPFRNFVLLESLPAALKAFLDAQRKPYSYPITIKVRTKWGAVRLLEMWGGPFLEHGKLAGVHVVASDITTIKDAEKEVRDSEERLRTIFEGSSDAIIVADPQTKRFTDCNRQAEKLLGCPKSEIITMGVDNIHPREELEKVGAAFARQARGSNETLDTLVVRRDGKRVPVGIKTASVTLKGRKALIGSFRDLTETKKAEQALRESERKYHSLMSSLQEGVWAIDADSRTTFVNDAMARMLGYKREEMMGKPLFSFMDERGVELAKADVERRKRGISEQHSFEFLRKDGSRIYALLETGPITDENGSYTGAIAGVTDITQRKKAEDDLRAAYEQLKTLDELKTDFVQIVSHELRTPLSSMRLASDLMAKELSPEEDREAHGIMRRNTDRMERIVSTVLNFSAIESGRVKYANAPVDASALAREAADNARAEAAAKGVSLNIKAGEPLVIAGDGFWLGIAIGNLVENAVKFTEKGGVTVETLRRGKGVLVRVRDTGLGLSKEDLEKTFQKFTKTHPNIEGSGIGLWMSKRIAEAHGGSVTIKSEGRGRGTTAELWLPSKGI